jgi:hypothetical protein
MEAEDSFETSLFTKKYFIKPVNIPCNIFISPPLTKTYIPYHVYWPILILTNKHICTRSPLLIKSYAPYQFTYQHLCKISVLLTNRHNITFTDQHLRTTWLLLTNTYAQYHLYWPTLTHNITFIDQHLHKLSLLLTNTSAQYHLYWPTLPHNITYIDQRFRKISP